MMKRSKDISQRIKLKTSEVLLCSVTTHSRSNPRVQKQMGGAFFCGLVYNVTGVNISTKGRLLS